MLETVQFSELLRNFSIAAAALVGLPLAAYKAWIDHKNSLIAERNHLTDTYAKAIEQIGKEELPTVLGGLYALEQIARNNKLYHRQIVEVLCSFIRHTSPSIDENHNVIAGGGPPSVSRSAELKVQAALDIIRRRKVAHELDQPSLVLDLRNINIARMTLEGASLRGGNLIGAVMNQCNLKSCDFSNADLRASELQNADVTGTVFTDAKLYNARLLCIDLTRSVGLSESQLESAQMVPPPPNDPTFGTMLPTHLAFRGKQVVRVTR